MISIAQVPTSFPHRLVALGAALILTTASVAVAQSRPPRRSGGPGDALSFEVLSIDPQSWVVTARDVGSGDEFSFRLPPEAFRGQRFTANVSDIQTGRRISVTGQPEARLRQVQVESPLGAARRAEGGFGGPPDRGGRDPGRFAIPDGPGRYGVRDQPRDSSRSDDRPAPFGQRGGGPDVYEVVEFDPTTRTVTARGEDGGTLSLEIDLQAFVGYRFRASVEDLRAGEGFELLAANERPLTDCCTVKERPRR